MPSERIPAFAVSHFGRFVSIEYSGLSNASGPRPPRILEPTWLIEVPIDIAREAPAVAAILGLDRGSATGAVEDELRRRAEKLPLPSCCLVCEPLVDTLACPGFLDLASRIAILSQSPGCIWHRSKRPNLDILHRRTRLAIVVPRTWLRS